MKLKVNSLTKGLLTLLLAAAISSFAFAQRTITGTVTDAQDGEPLISATVVVVGTSTGTITDFDGKYSLEVPADATQLEFSYTGYANQTVAIGASNVVDVALAAGTILDEIVVTGYGTSKRSDLTGSISSVKAEDFNGGIVAAPDQLVQGKVAGVQMINNSGAPGGETTFRIRGNSSVRAGNSPLFVVDGVPLDGRSARPGGNSGDLGTTPGTNPLNFINPNDIATIDVLKDASATAIYGSRGANGVVIITTKKGQAGAPTIDLNVSAGVSSLLKKLDVLDGDEYRAALDLYGINRDGSDFGQNVDAMDAITQTGITQNYNISIGGGSDNGSYRISAGLLDQEGIIIESGLEKYTGSINGSYKFIDNRLNIDFNLLAAHTTNNNAPISNDAGFTGSLVGNALQWNPTRNLRESDGSFARLSATTLNPLELVDAYSDVDNVTTVLGSIAPSFKITDKLTYKYLFSINRSTGSRAIEIKSSLNMQGVEDRGLSGWTNEFITTTQHTHTLSYADDLTESIGLNAVIGYEYQKFGKRGYGFGGQDFALPQVDYDYTNFLGATSQESRIQGSGEDPTTELQSYFGRVNLNISDKYLITGTIRADGSTKFGRNNRYGYFPSFAFAWNLTNESFLADGTTFDNLKFRLGWGQVGNQEFPSGAAQAQYGLGAGGALFLTNVANPDLKWETSTTFNAGIDFAVLDYKLSGSIEYFRKETEDLLFNFPTVQPAPDTRFWVNLPGKVLNSGVEVALNAFIIENDNLSFNIGANASFLTNELQDYTGPTILTGALTGQGSSGARVQKLESEQPINAFFVREFLGINDAGQNDLTDGGNTLFFLGDPNPDVLLGISAELSAGKFSAALNFNGAMGHELFNETHQSVIPIGNLGNRNIASFLLDTNGAESTSNPNTPSSRYLEDGSYLKLANATVGYNIGSIGSTIKNARIYLTGQNLLVFTGYDGFDPEVNTDKEVDGVPSFGIEYIPYPSARSFLLGVNLTF